MEQLDLFAKQLIRTWPTREEIRAARLAPAQLAAQEAERRPVGTAAASAADQEFREQFPQFYKSA